MSHLKQFIDELSSWSAYAHRRYFRILGRRPILHRISLVAEVFFPGPINSPTRPICPDVLCRPRGGVIRWGGGFRNMSVDGKYHQKRHLNVFFFLDDDDRVDMMRTRLPLGPHFWFGLAGIKQSRRLRSRIWGRKVCISHNSNPLHGSCWGGEIGTKRRLKIGTSKCPPTGPQPNTHPIRSPSTTTNSSPSSPSLRQGTV